MIANRFRIISKKGSGSFADVWQCEDLYSGEYVACKRMKQIFESVVIAEKLREIVALRHIGCHENILNLLDILYERKLQKVTLVFELMDVNLYELIKSRRCYFPDIRVQAYMYQLCRALDFLHGRNIFHRDIKPENVLIKGELLKLGDFGSCRRINSKPPYTEYISTRWYRSPECLLTSGYYDFKMDVWSVGCVFFEIVSLRPLFPGKNEMDQISCIHNTIGTVSDPVVLQRFSQHQNSHIQYNFPPCKGTGIDCLLPHSTPLCRELIKMMCTYDPQKRINARQAMRHPYFKPYRQIRKKQKPRSDLRHRYSYTSNTPATNVGSKTKSPFKLDLSPMVQQSQPKIDKNITPSSSREKTVVYLPSGYHDTNQEQLQQLRLPLLSSSRIPKKIPSKSTGRKSSDKQILPFIANEKNDLKYT